MIKRYTYFFFLLLVLECSLNPNSKFWTKAKKISIDKSTTTVLLNEDKRSLNEFNQNFKISLPKNLRWKSNDKMNDDGYINFDANLEKMSKYMAKLSLDMHREDILIPGVNLMREARRLRQFVSSLKQFLKENEFEKTRRKAARAGKKTFLEIGFSEDYRIEYVAFRNQTKRARRKTV